jgi:hypothetical protein
MNTCLWISRLFLFARSGDVICRAMLEPDTAPRSSTKSAVEFHDGSLTCGWIGIYSLYLSFDFSLSLPLSLSRPDFSQTRLERTTGSPDHWSVPHRNRPHQTASDRIAPHRTASHRIAPYRTTNTARSLFLSLALLQTAYSPLLLGLLLTLSYPIIGYTRATPLLSTACGTIKLQLSYQRTCVSHPCVKVIIFLYFYFMGL